MNPHFGLYLILTRPVAGYEECALAAVRAGVAFVQLRCKSEPPEERRRIARALRAVTQGTSTRLIVNDELGLAMEIDADGVHLGQGDPPGLPAARAAWPSPGKIFGLSTHNRVQAEAAVQAAADYIGVGPVWATPTKPDGDPPLGPAEAGRIVRASPVPAVVIGGIHALNLPEVLEAGAVNFAVVRAVNDAPDPLEAIEELISVWRAYVRREATKPSPTGVST